MSTTQKAAKERPILFSSAMVPALLSGAKTQTRRVMKNQPMTFEESDSSYELFRPDGSSVIGCPLSAAPPGARPFRTFTFDPVTSGRIAYAHCNYGKRAKSKQQALSWHRNWIGPYGRHEIEWSEEEIVRICPYGKPGERLWVRETFQLCYWTPDTWMGGQELEIWNDAIPRNRQEAGQHQVCVGYAADDIDGPFLPSIHMPRWASRITLEIAGVRIERVESISSEDAIAEGFTGYGAFLETFYRLNEGRISCLDNPWVWVIEFRRIKP